MMNFSKFFRLSALLCLFGFINQALAYPVSYCRLVRPQDGKCVDLIGDAHIPQRRSNSENTLIKTIEQIGASSEGLTVLWERPNFLNEERDREFFAEHFNKSSKFFIGYAWLELRRKNLKKVNLIAADNRPLEFYLFLGNFWGMKEVEQEKFCKKYNPSIENVINSLDNVQHSENLKFHRDFSRDMQFKKSLEALKNISFADVLKNHKKTVAGAALATVIDNEILHLISTTNERVLVYAGYLHVFNIRAVLEKLGFKVVLEEGATFNPDSYFYKTKIVMKVLAKLLTCKDKSKFISKNDEPFSKEAQRIMYEVSVSIFPEVGSETWQKLLNAPR